MQKPDPNTSIDETELPLQAASDLSASEVTLAARAQWMANALEEMREDLAEDRFTAAVGHFREALCLTRGFPELKAEADRQLIFHSAKLLPRNWRVAEVLLQEAAAAEPPFRPAADLQMNLRLARYEETITRAIQQADRAEFEGNINHVRVRLKDLIARYPGEERLTDCLYALDHPRRPAPISHPNANLAIVKSQAHTAAWALRNSPKNQRRNIVIGKGVWASAKQFGGMALTTGVLCAAGILAWQHFSTGAQVYSHPAKAANQPIPEASKPTPPASMEPAVALLPEVEKPSLEEQAWSEVKTSDDAASIQSFLTSYPGSPHALRARLRLAALQWQRVDKTNPDALDAYIHMHPRTPYKIEAERLILEARPANVPVEEISAFPTDREAILATVRQYQADPDFPLHDISGLLLEPVIEGDLATVVSRQDADGSPMITYRLARHGKSWKVETVR